MADPRSASLQTQPQAPTTVEPFGYGPSAQRPTNPKRGFPYWDTTINRLVVYTEGGWQIVGVQPAGMVGFGTTAQRPSGPPPGYVYYDVTLAAQFTWVGSGWIQTSPAAAAAAMVGAGVTAARPVNAPFGFLYHDTTLGQEIVWNSQAWIVIGPGQVTSGTPIPPPGPGPSTPAPVIFSSSTASGGVGTFLSYQIQATNSPTSFSCDSTVALAAIGLTFNTTTGLLSGTPTSAYSATVTFGATNSSGTGVLPVVFTIGAAPVTSGRWTSAVGECMVWQAYPCHVGAIVADSTASLLIFTMTAADGGTLPPGITYQVYNPNGTLLGSRTTEGGDPTFGEIFNINLGGGYTVIVSSSSAAVRVRASLVISNGGYFNNSAVRATLFNPVWAGVTESRISLTISGIVASTTLSSADFSAVSGSGYLTAPNYTWNFGGDTVNNPKTNFASGLSDLVLTGVGNPESSADVIIGVNG